MKILILRLIKLFWFNVFRLEHLLSLFKAENWFKYSLIEKEIILQVIENKYSRFYRVKPAIIKLINHIEEDVVSIILGKYNYKKNTIELLENISSLMILKTYYHEQKHKLQYYLSVNKRIALNYNKCLAIVEFDDSIYNDYGKNNTLQKLELDASFYSIEKILKLDYLFKNEKYWHELLTSINNYINEILNIESINYKTMKELVYINLSKANETAKISAEDYRKMIRSVRNKTFTISSLYNHIINLNKLLLENI